MYGMYYQRNNVAVVVYVAIAYYALLSLIYNTNKQF